MIDASWLLFVVASLALIATPGQDMILVMSRAVAQGAAAGVATAAGVSVGLVGHTILATLGLGAILRTSEWLFLALKLVGAAYLLYLGIGLLRTRRAASSSDAGRPRSLPRLFVDGAFSNISNPKVAIFYFALPAAVRRAVGTASRSHRIRARPHVRCAYLRREGAGRIFSGALSHWLRARPGVLTWIYRVAGAVLVGLGVKLALERR